MHPIRLVSAGSWCVVPGVPGLYPGESMFQQLLVAISEIPV